MELWEDISKKVGDAASKVGRGAEKLTDIAKLKYNLTVRQGKLEKQFEAIGRLHYEELTGEADNTEVIAEIVSETEALKGEIIELREKLDELTGAAHCAKCGAKIPRGSAFCPSCGEKQPEE